MIEAKANELRIGNKIWWLHEESEQVLTVDAEMITDIDHYNRFPDDDKYARGAWWAFIPLTPEILEKAGFKKEGGNWSRKRVSHHFIISIRHSDGQLLLNPHEFEIENKVKHLHQLQNLYYALTGKELEITL